MFSNLAPDSDWLIILEFDWSIWKLKKVVLIHLEFLSKSKNLMRKNIKTWWKRIGSRDGKVIICWMIHNIITKCKLFVCRQLLRSKTSSLPEVCYWLRVPLGGFSKFTSDLSNVLIRWKPLQVHWIPSNPNSLSISNKKSHIVTRTPDRPTYVPPSRRTETQ